MELGLVIPHTGPTATPSHIRAVCLAAEGAGLDCLWAVDHVVLPVHTDSAYPLGRRAEPVDDGALADQLAPNYECVATLAWVAGFTERIGLGTSIALLSVRNPVINSRQVATLDALSGGRLRYGVGVGWLREEIEAVGEAWRDRGRRAEEHVALLRHLWSARGEVVEFHGRDLHVPPMHPDPRPAQQPVPILFGGHSAIALERAGRLGDGWIAGPMMPDRLAELWRAVCSAAERAGRDPDALQLVASAVRSSPDQLGHLLQRYRDVGADHVQVRLHGAGAAAVDEVHRLGRLRRELTTSPGGTVSPT